MSKINFNPNISQPTKAGRVKPLETPKPGVSKPSAKETPVVQNRGETVSLSSPAKITQAQPKTEAPTPTPTSAPAQSTPLETTPNPGTTPLVVLDSTLSHSQPEHDKGIDGFLTQFLPQAESKQVGRVTKNQFDFDKGTEVVSGAQKFIVPVPTFSETGGGEDLVYPKGATDKEGKSLAGQPITDWQGKPIGGPGEKGVVFFNHKDQSYQAVKADGNGVVILNQVTDEQGAKLQEKIGKDPGKLSLQEFKGALEYAHSDLGVGDMYNSDRDFIKNKMNAMETSDTGVAQYGLHRRDDRDVCHAVYVEGVGEFQGPAATPQKFENGAVLIRQPDSKAEDGFAYRLIQPDAFQETYKNKDGSAIELKKLSTQKPTDL